MAAPLPALPTGTVTFLFTDVEGSTQLLNAHPEPYRQAVRRHHDLLLEAVQRAGGVVFETVGDAVYAAFSSPTAAVQAALRGQVALHYPGTSRWKSMRSSRGQGAVRRAVAPRRGPHCGRLGGGQRRRAD